MTCSPGSQELTAVEPDQSGINAAILNTIAALAGVIFVGFLADAFVTRRRARLKPEQQDKEEERTGRWTLALLVASYALLVPGLHLTIFSFSITLNIMGVEKVVVSAQDATFEVVERLYDRGAPLGAVVIFFYAVVVPALKLALLILGKLGLRNPYGSRPARWGRCCIACVQSLSKWASPDVFAYVLLIYMFRSMDNPPDMSTVGQLEAGFTCFCLFCVGSTLSSLWIHVPGEREEEEGTNERLGVASLSFPQPVQVRQGVFWAVWTWMVALFLFLFVAGLVTPCLRLEFDVESLYKHNACLTPFAPIINNLGIEELMRAEVSVWRCMEKLLCWGARGDLSSFVGLAMLAVFMLAITCLDVVFMTISAYRMCFAEGWATASRNSGPSWSRTFGKLCMLDVCIAGIVVIVLSLQSLRERGLITSWERGLAFLGGAELIHYVLYYILAMALPIRTQPTEENGDGKVCTAPATSCGKPLPQPVACTEAKGP